MKLVLVTVAVGLVFAIYRLVCVIQQSFLFQPSREILVDPASFGQRFDDLFLDLHSGSRVHGWFIPGNPGEKLVLFLPGAVGNLIHELNTLAFLHSFHVSVLAVEYPGFGKSDGSPHEGGCYAAAEAAWRYAVNQRGVEPENIILFGRCLGAAVAAWLASRYDCAALVCHSAWTSVPDLIAAAYPRLPGRYFCLVRFNTLKLIKNCRAPVLLLHSEKDRTVPASHSLSLFEQARSPKRFLSLIGDHYGNDWQASPHLRSVLAAMLNGNNKEPSWK